MTEHLTHGWEPDLDPGDSLLRRYVLANSGRSCAMAAPPDDGQPVYRRTGHLRLMRATMWHRPVRVTPPFSDP